MTLIICLDKNNGFSFNNRRQSRDSKVVERICNLSQCSKLHISEYSKNLFSLPCCFINVSDKPLYEAKENEFCFIENEIFENCLDIVSKLIVFRWDKVYPQDRSFEWNMENWTLVSTNTFKGTSHEEITEEVYIK